MTRAEPGTATERILMVIIDELMKRQPSINADDGLRTITITVVLNATTQQPMRVVVKQEGQTDLAGGRNGSGRNGQHSPTPTPALHE